MYCNLCQSNWHDRKNCPKDQGSSVSIPTVPVVRMPSNQRREQTTKKAEEEGSILTGEKKEDSSS